jgi:hypothetical protein
MKDPEPCKNGQNWWNRPNVLRPMSKRFGPPRLKGSTQEKFDFRDFHFGYRKAANDPAAAGLLDHVGSRNIRARFQPSLPPNFLVGMTVSSA